MDLFDYAAHSQQPLAERMRPRTLDELCGQDAILGPGRLLRTLIETDQVPSMILQGPPATGKTSLALVIQALTHAEFIRLNAVSLTVAELRSAIELAKDHMKFYGKKTIVFIDEIHTMKSNVQMSLLPVVEDGSLILIGATTESIAHEIVPPLASRCKTYTLTPLAKTDIIALTAKALSDPDRGYGARELSIRPDALEYLADSCNGDIRSALNSLEAAVLSTELRGQITLEKIKDACQFRLNSISTTDYYDLISAFIKSLRGSRTDAALYWLARMLHSGVDPLFIARRMVIHAAEDVGLANPAALQIAVAAKQAIEFIGMPEARIPLAEAVIYLCESPKSNSAYKAISRALELVKETNAYGVPADLKNSSGLYVNPLDHPGATLHYLPEELADISLYTPQNSGFEQQLYNKRHKK
ncbi:MAG: replication-associated recombination protein A [Peptococcaceae bacterium]|jgi:putative ATPase|nr:replication-associated recombination protein A [Peptococcaceae bacterium]